MEIRMKMDVSAKEFFDALYESIIQDVKVSANKSVSKSTIKKGFSYSKTLRTRLGRDGSAKVTIKDLVDNEKYVVGFLSSQGENIVSYVVEQLDDNSIGMTYTEEYIGASKLKDLNFSLMSWLFKRGNKKRILTSLGGMETYIIQKRDVK